jgi:hypothetical protein
MLEERNKGKILSLGITVDGVLDHLLQVLEEPKLGVYTDLCAWLTIWQTGQDKIGSLGTKTYREKACEWTLVVVQSLNPFISI